MPGVPGTGAGGPERSERALQHDRPGPEDGDAQQRHQPLHGKVSSRSARLLNDPLRPGHVIFTGKAHPRGNPGKELIRQVVSLSRQEIFRKRIVFLEDYDMNLARYLVWVAYIL